MHASFKVLSIAAVAGLGLITAAFAQHQAHRFNASALDTGHDGIVSDAELGMHIDQLFAQSDTDRNGQLDQTELSAFHQMMRGAMSSKSTMARGNGQPMMTTMSQAQFRQVMAGFASGLDADGDRVLTVAELNTAFQPDSAN